MYVHVYVYTYVYIYVYICIYVYIYMYTYACVFIYIYTNREGDRLRSNYGKVPLVLRTLCIDIYNHILYTLTCVYIYTYVYRYRPGESPVLFEELFLARAMLGTWNQNLGNHCGPYGSWYN